ncbi:hypothetical protein ACIHCM_31010 [Streptomyces sp. NPDC052023]|uniref:hypothetical protein n=1 Tax=Streptomyces sp. NPDC052023 TaxID=3365681 RepID=UPI0037D50DF0
MSEAMEAEAVVPIGYTIVPPPGWDRIPLRDGTSQAIKRIADGSMLEIPDDIPRDHLTKARMELIKRLKRVARQARDARALDLYLPVERINGLALPASFVVSEPFPTLTLEVDSPIVLSSLRPDASQSDSVIMDGAAGFRIDGVAQADSDKDVEFPSRRVEYILNVPNSAPPKWLTISFSTIADGQPDGEFAAILVDLFDAVMTTFRWSHS